MSEKAKDTGKAKEAPPVESETERLDRLRKEDSAGKGRSEKGE